MQTLCFFNIWSPLKALKCEKAPENQSTSHHKDYFLQQSHPQDTSYYATELFDFSFLHLIGFRVFFFLFSLFPFSCYGGLGRSGLSENI